MGRVLAFAERVMSGTGGAPVPITSFWHLREGSVSQEQGPGSRVPWAGSRGLAGVLKQPRPRSVSPTPSAHPPHAAKCEAVAAPKGSPLTSNAFGSGPPGSWGPLPPQALHAVHALSTPSCGSWTRCAFPAGSLCAGCPLGPRTLLSRHLMASVPLSPRRQRLPGPAREQSSCEPFRCLPSCYLSSSRSPPLLFQCTLSQGRVFVCFVHCCVLRHRASRKQVPSQCPSQCTDGSRVLPGVLRARLPQGKCSAHSRSCRTQ